MTLINVDPNSGCQPGTNQCPANFSRPLTLYDLIDYQLKVDDNIIGPNKVLIDVPTDDTVGTFTGGGSVDYSAIADIVGTIVSENFP